MPEVGIQLQTSNPKLETYSCEPIVDNLFHDVPRWPKFSHIFAARLKMAGLIF